VKLFMVAWSATRHPTVEVWQGSALDKLSHPTTVELARSPQSGCDRRSHRGSGIEVRMHIREREHWPRPSSRYLQSSSPRACGVAPTHPTSVITSQSTLLAPTAASPVRHCGEVACPVRRPSELRTRCHRCPQARPNQDDTAVLELAPPAHGCYTARRLLRGWAAHRRQVKPRTVVGNTFIAQELGRVKQNQPLDGTRGAGAHAWRDGTTGVLLISGRALRTNNFRQQSSTAETTADRWRRW
jgi:hypothetical protein